MRVVKDFCHVSVQISFPLFINKFLGNFSFLKYGFTYKKLSENKWHCNS